MSILPDDVSWLFGSFQLDRLIAEVEFDILITDLAERVLVLERDVEGVWTHVFFKVLVLQLS